MDTIKQRIEAAKKANLGAELTAKPWEPKEGDTLMGEYVTREVIVQKETQKHYDKVVLRCDEGLYETIIKAGVLSMSDPPLVKGDLLVIKYNGLKPIGDGKRSMHDSSVTIYHTGVQDASGLY